MDAANCANAYQAIVDTTLLRDADVIVLAMFWWPQNLTDAAAFVADLRQRTKADIRVAGPKALSRNSIEIVNALGTFSGANEIAAGDISDLSKTASAALKGMFPDTYVDLLASICPGGRLCYVVTDTNEAVFWDQTHLTAAGAGFLAVNGLQTALAFLDAQDATGNNLR